MEENKSGITVPALERGLNVLELLAAREQPISLKFISKELNIPSASAFRLMKNLTARGYAIEKNGGQILYSVGPKLLEIAYRCNRNMSLSAIARPIMEVLSEKTGQTSQLAILSGSAALYTEQVFPSTPVSIIAPLHTPVPIHISAAGKIIAANQSKDEMHRLVNQIQFDKRTHNTIMDRYSLTRELEDSAERGYALDDEEYAAGIGCVAAPIFNGEKRCIAAIGITGHILSYRDNHQFPGLIQKVKQAASSISSAYGFISESN